MDMLRITNLKKHFGDKEVLTGLNLSVPEHSVFGFVGENGAGKTTTMKIILGEYYGAAEPPVRCGESHLSGLTEPPHFVY